MVGPSENYFLGMGNSTNQVGDWPADCQFALCAIEFMVTSPDHVEPGFCQLTDQTIWTCTCTLEISELFSSRRITCSYREVSHNDVHTVNSLSVADNRDKLRLILDLRHVNQFLRVPKIKFEDI